jgi:hypothetical protein
MGFEIVDGKGSGLTAGVNSDNRFQVSAVEQSVEHFVNHTKGESYNLLFTATPTGPGDCFLYIKNTAEIDMVLEGFWIKLEANEYLEIKIGDTGTVAGGTDITPVNLNGGSGKTALGAFQNGVDITGLTGGQVSHRIYHASSVGSIFWNFNQDIILPKNRAITIYAQTGTTEISGIMVFNYHSIG